MPEPYVESIAITLIRDKSSFVPLEDLRQLTQILTADVSILSIHNLSLFLPSFDVKYKFLLVDRPFLYVLH